MCRTECVGRVQGHITTITLRIIVPGSFALAARVLGGADSNRGSDVRWGHTTHCSWVPDDGLHSGCIHRSSPWRLSRRIGQLFHWRQGDFSFLFPTRRGARFFFPFSSTAANFCFPFLPRCPHSTPLILPQWPLQLAVVGSLLSALIAGFAPEDRVKGATSPEASSSAAKAAETKSGGVTGGLTEMFDTAMLVLPLLGTKIIISIGNAMYQGWVLCSTRLQSSLNPAWHAVDPVEGLFVAVSVVCTVVVTLDDPTPHQRVGSHADCSCACVSQEHADCASRQFQILRIPDGAIHVELHGLKRRLLGTVRQADCRAIPWSSDSGVSCVPGAVHNLCCSAVGWRHCFSLGKMALQPV